MPLRLAQPTPTSEGKRRLPIVHEFTLPIGPLNRPIVTIPAPRPGSKQLTVLRHDNHGVVFLDQFVERFDTWMLKPGELENRRLVNHIVCPLMGMSVSLTACPSYCTGPCRDHVAALSASGWYHPGGSPRHPIGRKSKKRASDDGGEE